MRTPSTRIFATEAVVAALHANRQEAGMTHADIVSATGLTGAECSKTLPALRDTGRVYSAGTIHDTHYFPTEEARDAGRDAVNQKVAALQLERKARRDAKKAEYQADPKRRETAAKNWREKAALLKAARPPKPAKLPKVQKATARPATGVKPGWGNQVAIVPPHVQKQVCPGYDGDRWKPEIPADGYYASRPWK